jgi:hypothetical protein
MEHLFQQVRPPIDAFESLVIEVFSAVAAVDAIWIRERPLKEPCTRPHPHQPDASCPGAGPVKKYARGIWVQCRRATPGTVEALERRARELEVRAVNTAFLLHIEWIVDALPSDKTVPSCVYRRFF